MIPESAENVKILVILLLNSSFTLVYQSSVFLQVNGQKFCSDTVGKTGVTFMSSGNSAAVQLFTDTDGGFNITSTSGNLLCQCIESTWSVSSFKKMNSLVQTLNRHTGFILQLISFYKL